MPNIPSDHATLNTEPTYFLTLVWAFGKMNASSRIALLDNHLTLGGVLLDVPFETFFSKISVSTCIDQAASRSKQPPLTSWSGLLPNFLIYASHCVMPH